jgi:ATP-dependent helicase/nuclease subunit A
MGLTYTAGQQKAVEHRDDHLCVDAGAGSGKTRVLVDRIVALLDDDPKLLLHQIVAITFTRKAASEMKERLRKAFRQRASQSKAHEMAVWRERERQLDAARITTIDSFCAVILREHAVALGLDPDFQLADEPEAQKLRSEVALQTLEPMLARNHASAVVPAVEYGVEELIKQLSILLGAPHCQRILDEHVLDSAESLLIHWAAISETAVAKLVERIPHSPQIFNFKRQLESMAGLCSDPEDGREYARLFFLNQIDGLQQAKDTGTIQKIVEQIADYDFRTKTGSKKNWGEEEYKIITKRTTAFREYAKSQMCDTDPPDDYTIQLTCAVYDLLRRANKAYQQAKRDSAILDFTDLLQWTVHALDSDERLREDLKDSIRYLFVDEFQDTNDAQLEMVQHLIDFEKSSGAELFVVGDPKQSIYNFRGAEVEVFNQVRRDTGAPIQLDDNFRSVPEIMEFINHFFRESRHLYGVEPEYRGLKAIRTPVNEPRTVFIVPDAVEEWKAADYRDRQARLLAQELLSMCSGPKPAIIGSTESQREAGFGDISILFRSKTHMPHYEKILNDYGIPARILEGTGFYQQQEIADLRNALKALVDPWDARALLGYLRSPLAALDDDALYTLSKSRGLTKGFLSECTVAKSSDAVKRVRTQFSAWQQMIDGPVSTLLHSLLQDTGIEAVLLDQPYGMQKASNVHKILEMAHQYDAASSAGLWGFIDFVDDSMQREVRESEAGLLEERDGTVKLMTIHSSKGLEFPVVVLAETAVHQTGGSTALIESHRNFGLVCSHREPLKNEDKTFRPAYGKIMTQQIKNEEEDESARQLYVALTRAEDWLMVMGTPNHKNSIWKNSWMEFFDHQYQLLDRSHDDVFGEAGWKAKMIRTMPAGAIDRDMPAELSLSEIDTDRVLKQIAHIPVPETPSTLTVSEWLNQHNSASDEENAVGSFSSMERMERGTLIHRYFEAWNVRSSPPSPQDWLQLNAPSISLNESLVNTLNEAVNFLQQTELFTVWDTDSAPLKEVPFQILLHDQLIRGTIDIILPDGTILDYKTGSAKNHHSERYTQQLRLYAHAARTLGMPINNRAQLFYVDALELVEVDVTEEKCVIQFS